MRKKLYTLFIASCATLLIMTGCGVGDDLKEQNKEKPTDKVIEEVTKETGDIHHFKTAEDFWVTYAEKKYMIPTDSSIFNGWSIATEVEDLEADQYGMGVQYKKEGYSSVAITPFNDSSEVKKVTDCRIVGVSVDKGLDSAKSIEVELPNKIKIGSSYADILGAYGTPTLDEVNKDIADIKTVEYKIDNNRLVRFKLTKDIVDIFQIKYIP